MKRVLSLITIVLMVICLTGCGNNTVNESNNSNKGSSLEDKLSDTRYMAINTYTKLVCDDMNQYDIVDINYDVMLLSNGKVYSILLENDKFYSNDQQCKPVSDDIKFKYIDENRCLVSEDNKRYFYSGGELNEEDNKDYNIPDVLFKDNIKKVAVWALNEEQSNKYQSTYLDAGNKSISTHYTKYVYIKDGSIYEGFVKKTDYLYYGTAKSVHASDELVEEKMLYSKDEYGNITDFKDLQFLSAWNSYIVSDKGVYRYSNIETEECKKYEDIECEKKFVRTEVLDKYTNDIKFINGNVVVTKNNYITTLKELLEYDGL